MKFKGIPREEERREEVLSATAMKSLPARPLSIQKLGGLSAPRKTRSTLVMGRGTWFCSVCYVNFGSH